MVPLKVTHQLIRVPVGSAATVADAHCRFQQLQQQLHVACLHHRLQDTQHRCDSSTSTICSLVVPGHFSRPSASHFTDARAPSPRDSAAPRCCARSVSQCIRAPHTAVCMLAAIVTTIDNSNRHDSR